MKLTFDNTNGLIEGATMANNPMAMSLIVTLSDASASFDEGLCVISSDKITWFVEGEGGVKDSFTLKTTEQGDANVILLNPFYRRRGDSKIQILYVSPIISGE